MSETDEKPKKEKGRSKNNNSSGAGGAIYGLGLIGALIYFIQNAESFWAGVLGVLQALVWPAFVVYKLLESLYS